MSHPIIAFDLDGTLVDTAPDLIDTLNAVFAEKGVPELAFDAARDMIGGGVKVLLERGLSAQGQVVTSEQLNDLYDDYLQRYAARVADRSRPFPGVEAALDKLAALGYRFAVCTNKLE